MKRAYSKMPSRKSMTTDSTAAVSTMVAARRHGGRFAGRIMARSPSWWSLRDGRVEREWIVDHRREDGGIAERHGVGQAEVVDPAETAVGDAHGDPEQLSLGG